MTTYQTTRLADEAEDREWAPAEGWTTVGLALVMLLTLGLAVDSAQWVGTTIGGVSRTAFLPLVLLAGAAWGFIGAKSSLPALVVHAIGALIGGLLVVVLVADVNSTAEALADQLEALSLSIDRFAIDLIVRQVRSPETAPFLLVTGCIAWATGAYASFAIFRRHRPMDALVVCGLLLLANLALSYKSLFAHLVIFSAAALLLLVRANLDEQRSGWLRRRIGDAGHVSGLFMRSGLSFVAVALAGAVVLTTFASSKPLEGFWRSYQSDLASIGQELNRWVGGLTAPARGPNSLFTSSQVVGTRWESDPAIAYIAKPSDGEAHYWRAAVYDEFNGGGWNMTDRVGVRIEAGQKVLGGSIAEIPEEAFRDPVTVEFTAVQPTGDIVLSPDAPLTIADRALNVTLNGEGGPFLTAQFADGFDKGESYTIETLVRADPEDEDRGLTASKLQASSRRYPSFVEPYSEVLPGTIGSVTTNLADQIMSSLPLAERDDYHYAKAVQDYLRDPGKGFEYTTTVPWQCDSGLVVDCFLETRNRSGFCQQFASAMVMLLRAEGVPSRLAMGYLPGVAQDDGTWQIDRGSAHAWVEVYFADHGWVQFDPTPGAPVQARGGVRTDLPVGQPVATTPPGPGASLSPFDRSFDREFDGPGADRIGELPTQPIPGPLGGGWLAVIVVAGFVIAVAAVAWSVRERRRPTPAPDAIYGGIGRLAKRFGYGPRPTQTTYEYAATLGEVIPAARDEIDLVARVKVETQYARRTPSPDVLLAVRHAYRRIRLRLLTLAFRRPRRP